MSDQKLQHHQRFRDPVLDFCQGVGGWIVLALFVGFLAIMLVTIFHDGKLPDLTLFK